MPITLCKYHIRDSSKEFLIPFCYPSLSTIPSPDTLVQSAHGSNTQPVIWLQTHGSKVQPMEANEDTVLTTTLSVAFNARQRQGSLVSASSGLYIVPLNNQVCILDEQININRRWEQRVVGVLRSMLTKRIAESKPHKNKLNK